MALSCPDPGSTLVTDLIKKNALCFQNWQQPSDSDGGVSWGESERAETLGGSCQDSRSARTLSPDPCLAHRCHPGQCLVIPVLLLSPVKYTFLKCWEVIKSRKSDLTDALGSVVSRPCYQDHYCFAFTIACTKLVPQLGRITNFHECMSADKRKWRGPDV